VQFFSDINLPALFRGCYRYCFDDVMQWSGMNRRLPDNVHLLTLEQWEAGTILLRLEHFYAKGEDPVLSQPAKVQLKVCTLLLFMTIDKLMDVVV